MSVKDVSAKKFDALHKKRIDLKRCPACPNYDAEIIIPNFVKCTKCNAYMEYCNEKTAINAWNRRAENGKS